jgi:hypothetical protein
MPTELNYANYEYSDIVSQFETKLKATNAWKDTYQSATGTTLTQFVAGIGNMLMYYLERQATENYIGLASNKSSVVNLVKLLNYRPKRPVGSTGTLVFSVPSAPSTRVIIPQYTECQTADGIIFTTIYDITIETTQTSNNVTAIQGQLTELTFTSDGTADQEFDISDTSVDNDDHTTLLPFRTFRVYVDDVEWTYVSSFLSSSSTDSHFTIKSNLDDTITVVFGDNTNGAIPGTSSTITVKYISTSGLSGNIYETGKVTTVRSTIYNESLVEVSTIAVTNSTTMTGGDDAETAEEIAAEAPNVFATGGSLSRKKDYVSFIQNYSSVADVNVWGEAEESPPNYDMFNTVKISTILQNWQLPTASFKTTLSASMRDYSMLTVKYEYVDPDIIYVIVYLSVVVNSGYALTQVQSDINGVLTDQFTLGTTSLLGESKRASNVIQAIDSLAGVKYLSLTMKLRQSASTSYNSLYDWGTALNCTSVKTSSVYIYGTVSGTEDVLIAADDGSGNIVTQHSVATVSGTVNYTTGVLVFDVSGISPTDVYVIYEQDESGDIVLDSNQICRLSSTVFSSIGY